MSGERGSKQIDGQFPGPDGPLQSFAGTVTASDAVAFDPPLRGIRCVGAGHIDLLYAGDGAATGQLQMTVVAAAGTITRAAGSGSFIVDGFVAAAVFATLGFVNGGNNATKTIATVTDRVITVTNVAGLVDEVGPATTSASTLPNIDAVTVGANSLTTGVLVRQVRSTTTATGITGYR